MNQLNMFDSGGGARASDPDSSKQAAKHDFRGHRLLIVNLLTLHPNRTSAELAAVHASSTSEPWQVWETRIHKRMAELVRSGVVAVVEERTCHVTGRLRQAYRTT